MTEGLTNSSLTPNTCHIVIDITALCQHRLSEMRSIRHNMFLRCPFARKIQPRFARLACSAAVCDRLRIPWHIPGLRYAAFSPISLVIVDGQYVVGDTRRRAGMGGFASVLAHGVEVLQNAALSDSLDSARWRPCLCSRDAGKPGSEGWGVRCQAG